MFCTQTRFEIEAQENSEVAYWTYRSFHVNIWKFRCSYEDMIDHRSYTYN